LGLFVVSVSILKGVIVKSELLPRSQLQLVQDSHWQWRLLSPVAHFNAKGLQDLLQPEGHLFAPESR
jgi:hypothetical protein